MADAVGARTDNSPTGPGELHPDAERLREVPGRADVA